MMINKMCFKEFIGVLVILLISTVYGQIYGNVPSPDGTFRAIPRTSFSCQQRGSGYYADIETGCQIYHMCDELGRQFSYSCPNTTLFQQRMLICDHWYMVNCSRAEDDYDANLLIGQRDKPFVNEGEHPRTPRPDLLDSPYSADYTGESYRKQFKNISPAIQNTIVGATFSKQYSEKSNLPREQHESSTQHVEQYYSVPGRWSIQFLKNLAGLTTPLPPPSPTPPPKQLVRQNEPRQKFNDRRNVKDEATAHVVANRRQDDTSDEFFTRNRDSIPIPVFTNFQQQQPPSRTQVPVPDRNELPPKLDIKKPSMYYETPLLFPEYNLNYSEEKTSNEPFRISLATTQRTTELLTTAKQIIHTTPTTIRRTSSSSSSSTTAATPGFLDVRPSEINIGLTSTKTSHKDYDFSKYVRGSNTQSSQKPLSTLPPNGARILTGTTNTFNRIENTNTLTNPNIILPATDLQPPHDQYKNYDDSSTQGPPIYYEWKWALPASDLEPPKLDFAETVPTISPDASPFKPDKNKFAHNPFLTAAFARAGSRSTEEPQRGPTARSVSSSAFKFNSNSDRSGAETSSEKLTTNSDKITIPNFKELRKKFLIPDYVFPLETGVPGQFEDNESVNSFQIKIPESSTDKPWYGENKNCPECHPSFVKPGTCEPCIKIR